MWGPYCILKMIKKLFLGLFGLYFMDVCNNKTHRNIFDIFWGKESPSFFMFLLIFRMKHHNENNAMAGGAHRVNRVATKSASISHFGRRCIGWVIAFAPCLWSVNRADTERALGMEQLWGRVLACYRDRDRTPELAVNEVSAHSPSCSDAL